MIQAHDRAFVVWITAGYIAVSLSLLLSWPLLWPDEAIFADTARSVLLSGHPSTAFVPGMESGAYWQPPAWFYVMAPVIGVFGYDILPLRIACLLIGAGILWATFSLGRELGVSPWASRCSLVLLAFNPNFVTYVKFARMDGLCVLFTLLGVYSYARLLKDTRTRWLWLSALFFGAAGLTHPLGVLGPAIAGCHALFDRRVGRRRTALTLICAALAVIAAGGGWWLSAGNHGEALVQLGYQLRGKTRPFPAPLISFAERYRSLPLFALLIPAGIAGAWRRTRGAMNSFPLLLAVGVTLATAAVALTFEIPYHLYCLPLLALAAAVTIESFRTERPGARLTALLAAAAVVCNFAAYFAFFNYEFHFNLRDETDYRAFTGKIAEEIPKDATVCIAGYPCVYWGLNTLNRGYTLIDERFITDSLGVEAAGRAGWFVVANGFSPEDDRPDVLLQIKIMTDFAARAGRKCVLRDFIGTRTRFSYTARIFQIVASGSAK